MSDHVVTRGFPCLLQKWVPLSIHVQVVVFQSFRVREMMPVCITIAGQWIYSMSRTRSQWFRWATCRYIGKNISFWRINCLATNVRIFNTRKYFLVFRNCFLSANTSKSAFAKLRNSFCLWIRCKSLSNVPDFQTNLTFLFSFSWPKHEVAALFWSTDMPCI